MSAHKNQLIGLAARLARDQEEASLLTGVFSALDDRYNLSRKMAGESGVEDIILQLVGRLQAAFGHLAQVKGQRILDLACGSKTSKSPAFIYVNTPVGERRIRIAIREEYTAMFEPWLCRMLVEMGADPVGVDMGDLESEAFEHDKVDLAMAGSLDFLPDHSFDAVHDSRLFGSPEFTDQFPDSGDRLRVAQEMVRQEQRLLKPGGIVIHSDAQDLLR